MTLTVENATQQARQTWHRLGVNKAAAEEMAEELSADLVAADLDGRSVADYIGGDIEALATSWAMERGLLPVQHRRLKEIAAAAAKGAALPALLAVFLCWVSWSHLLDPCTGRGTGPGGEVLGCRTTLDAWWMWAGWALCAAAAYWLVLRGVSRRLEHHLAAGRDATRRTLVKTLPLIVVAAALAGGGIGLLGAAVLGNLGIVAFPGALAAMPAAVAGGCAWIRHHACPPVDAIS
ncbi:hypothetical protein OTB20_41440 [Streptomyces sp. H27-H1]|uniref:hypothetical protein n=1 Tax=Streptomyces sp. H27-H1 TaxID=2996461 RepID=UPI00226D5079|nr:hypothetical protein [Streptomyces sp. H27-H1]MCY0932491.1 hypothetical protein [Streptomyces sp. H27-H1]